MTTSGEGGGPTRSANMDDVGAGLEKLQKRASDIQVRLALVAEHALGPGLRADGDRSEAPEKPANWLMQNIDRIRRLNRTLGDVESSVERLEQAFQIASRAPRGSQAAEALAER